MRAYIARYGILSFAVGSSVLLASACSDSVGPRGARALSVSFSTAKAAPARSVSASLAASPADSIVLSKAQLVLSNVELAKVDAACAITTQGQEGDCEDIEVSPAAIELPLTAGAKTAFSASIPDGTYSGLEARISPARAGSNGASIVTAHPELADKSIRVEGTFGGAAFVYSTDLTAELHLSFSPPIAVTKDGLNVTVGVDVSSWFRDASGARLDPRNAANAATINANIRRSFKAYEDDDKDGGDDHR
ncbi:hypothetical protein BH11GEM1_BH11GEM1_02370 [soil metagenome]